MDRSEYLKKWKRENPVSRSRHSFKQKLRQRYGIEPEDWARLYNEQNGQCAICGSTEKLNLDHDHETGEVRGILCWDCNVSLGKFTEKELENALEYLRAAHRSFRH